MHITAKQYATALFSAVTDHPSQTADIFKQLLQKMYQAGDWHLVAEMYREFERAVAAANNSTTVVVKSARSLDKNMVNEIVQQLINAQNTEIEYVEDPTLIGGLRIQTENQRWDLSLRGQLQQLEHNLNQ